MLRKFILGPRSKLVMNSMIVMESVVRGEKAECADRKTFSENTKCHTLLYP